MTPETELRAFLATLPVLAGIAVIILVSVIIIYIAGEVRERHLYKYHLGEMIDCEIGSLRKKLQIITVEANELRKENRMLRTKLISIQHTLGER